MRCFVVPEGASAAVKNSFAEIIAIHAALLLNGKIVYFAGDQHDPGQFTQGLFDQARLFDCTSLAVTACTPAAGITDLFCCGHAFLNGGRLLIAGGTRRFNGFQGRLEAWIFDPSTSSFLATGAMSDGRWYPTLLTLGNGRVLAMSGLNAAGNDQNRNMDVYTPGSEIWTVEGIVSYGTDTTYPRMHVLPNGHVFFVTPMNGQSATWHLGDPTPTLLGASPFAGMGFTAYTSALLPLLPEESYAPRIVVANVAQPQMIDLSTASPVWVDTGSRHVLAAGMTSANPPRINGTLTYLPTGELLSAGGEQNYGDESRPVLALELYRPATNSWLTLPVVTTVTRAYHSSALLMPDGRVWFAGSDKRCDWSFHNSASYRNMPPPTNPQDSVGGVPVDNRELRIEIFEPWYFGRPDRPTFTVTSNRVGVGGILTITTPDAPTISRVALVRAGTSTHGFNPDQRYVGLPFTVGSPTSLTATVPDNENLVPPGHYLLFILNQIVDDSGAALDVPSLGTFVELVNLKRVKELKPEVENLKLEFEIPLKINEVVDPGVPDRGDPAFLLSQLAVTVDNIAREVGTGRSFIKPEERPLVAQVSPQRLAQVPIFPLAPEVLTRQSTMEGMYSDAGAQMPQKAPKAGRPQIEARKAPTRAGKRKSKSTRGKR
jgi:hypothetical protein